jgi:hypothetical protein
MKKYDRIINFNDELWLMEKISYNSGRTGYMMRPVSGDGVSFNATLDPDWIKIELSKIVVKDWDRNFGLVECLKEHYIVEKQTKPIKIGSNIAHVCTLIS